MTDFHPVRAFLHGVGHRRCFKSETSHSYTSVRPDPAMVTKCMMGHTYASVLMIASYHYFSHSTSFLRVHLDPRQSGGQFL